MAEQTNPTIPTKFTFDETKFKSYIESCKTYFKQFAGKKNHNPFLPMKTVVECEQKFNSGDKSETLWNILFNINQTPPVINPNYTESAPAQLQQPIPQGLSLPQPKQS